MRGILIGFVLMLVFLPVPANAQDYYVDATGGSNSNNGTSPSSAWKNISRVNSMSFGPGDSILFKRGETWRERLAPPSPGSAGNPIIFGAYGTGDKPIINGADLVTPWTDDGSNVWYADLTSEPRQVFFDNVRGNNQTSKADVDSDKDWYWEGNTLYVYSVGNPDTVYTNPGMEVSDSSRVQCISIHAKSYIDIRDLDLRNAYAHCLDMYNSDNINVYDNDISNSGKRGIYTSTSSYMDIYRNTFEWCGVELVTPEHGIYLGTNSSHVDVYENEVSYSWNSGIKCDSVSDVKVYRNYVHDNNQEYSYFGEIHIGSSAADLSNLEIYYNLIEIGDGYGIHSGYLYGHTKTNVSIYNNVIWDNNAGPAPKNYAFRLENIDTLNIKNNAIKTAREYVMRYNNNSNVIRDYNCYYGWTHATRMGNIDGSWVTWSDVSAVETNSINSDPLFENPSNHNYHLKSNSPCIDNGTYVGLTQDYEGNPVPQGNGTDIGAYEYSGLPPPNCTGICKPNNCSTYDNCTNGSGTCLPGEYCCSGNCTHPLPLPGLSWEAEDGVITSPFTVSNGYVFQSIVTLDDPSSGGKASYRFNIDNPGDYIIKTIINASDGASNSFFVNIDAEPTFPDMIWDVINLTNGFEDRTVSWRGNGTYDNNEFDPKIFTLTSGEHELIIRGREAYTLLDNITLEYYETLPADLNNDGSVDIKDLAIIATNFGKTSGYDPESDVVQNGEIDIFDVVFVASRFS